MHRLRVSTLKQKPSEKSQKIFGSQDKVLCALLHSRAIPEQGVGLSARRGRCGRWRAAIRSPRGRRRHCSRGRLSSVRAAATRDPIDGKRFSARRRHEYRFPFRGWRPQRQTTVATSTGSSISLSVTVRRSSTGKSVCAASSVVALATICPPAASAAMRAAAWTPWPR